MTLKKPEIAFFSFTCCEGCQLVVLNCEEEFPDIVGHVRIKTFREAMSEGHDAPHKGYDAPQSNYEIAFIEGSISKREEIAKLKKIRRIAKTVVALGACAATGGINCLKNRFTMDAVKKIAYGKNASRYKILDTIPAVPIDSIIKVDHYIHGCPITKEEFLSTLKSLILGKPPDVPNYPVCTDCKRAGNVCVFEKGLTCMGPVTRAGCRAVCVTYGDVCGGCRGPVDDPNIDAHKATLKRCGLSDEEISKSFDLYGVCAFTRGMMPPTKGMMPFKKKTG